MNIRELDYICAVARFEHFGRAAEHCNVSQPTLSGQIKKLEAELGVTLFERDNKNVRVTQIGRQIIEQARAVRQGVDAIKETAKAAQDPLSGRLRIGLIPTIAPYLIPLFSGAVAKAFPALTVTYYEEVTERLNSGLLDGDIDVAVLATEPETDRLVARDLYSEPFWSVVPRGHELSQQVSLQAADLPKDELLLLPEGHCFRDQALGICNLVSSPYRAFVWATSLETLVNMVAAGQGVTLVPALALDGQLAQKTSGPKPSLVAMSLSEANAARTVNLTYRKSFHRVTLVQALAEVILKSVPKRVMALPG